MQYQKVIDYIVILLKQMFSFENLKRTTHWKIELLTTLLMDHDVIKPKILLSHGCKTFKSRILIRQILGYEILFPNHNQKISSFITLLITKMIV